MSEQPVVDFAGLLRLLRGQALLTQEELAEAAGLSPRAVSDLERGIHRTARKDTALLLGKALGLDGPARELFVAAALGRAPAGDVLAVGSGRPGASGGAAGRQAGRQRPVGAVVGSPYRGLKAFGEQDAGFFFGREAATAQVLARMAHLVAGAGVLVVSGVSGAGKSSLLAAGVLPQIRTAGLAGAPEAAGWPRVVFTPTHAPLDELALRVAPLAGADAAGVRRGLDADPAGFALTARQAALARPAGPAAEGSGEPNQPPPQQQRRLVLVVDQFEELFTQCDQEGQRRAFITALHAAATSHGPGHTPAALVVLGVRADFEAHCADYPQLSGAIQDRYLVTAMTERQLRMAITEPAKKAGSVVDDDLAGVLLGEVRNGQPGMFAAGVLPLLSHALDQAWRSGTGETVTLADYERTGGIEGAVAASAQRAYDALTPAQKTAARHVFTRLTATSGEGIDSADRATRADLTAGKTPAEAQDVDQVLESFATERLLTLAAGTVELSHEVLLTAWPLLRDTWLADTHAERIARTRLHRTAAEWDHHARDPSYLYTGTLLQAATAAAARITADPARHPPLGQAETDFLHASEHAHQRTARRRQAMFAGLLVLTLIAAGTAVIAVRNAAAAGRNAASARRQHAIALSRQLTAESLSVNPTDPVIARQLAVAAWRVFPTSQADSLMATLLTEQQQNGILPADPFGVTGVAFSPGGTLLATAGADGTVRLWNPDTGQPAGAPLPAGAQYSVNAVAFSSNGTLLASGGDDGTVRLWNPDTHRAVGRPIHAGTANTDTAQGGVSAVAFSPDGTLLASADVDGTVRLWNPDTHQAVGRPIHADTAAQGGVSAVAFSPDGTLLASGGRDGTVRLWNPDTHQAVGRPIHAGTASTAAAPGGVSAVAFSPDGNLLASASGDGTVRLWNPDTHQAVGRPIHADTGHNGVGAVAFSPDGTLLASAGGNGTVRLWNPDTHQAVGRPIHADTGPNGGVFGVAFSPDGNLLASGGGDGTVRLWNPATGQPAGTPIHTAQGGVDGVAFSPDGTLLASGGDGDTVRLWIPATGQPVGRPIPADTGPNGSVFVVAFSPDGTLLAGIGRDGTVRLWNPATHQAVGTPIHTAQRGVSGVAFSPDGTLLASAGADGTVRLWNPATHQAVSTPIHTAQGGVLGMKFSPDGTLLASAGLDGTVRLWNPATGQPVGTPIPASTEPSGVLNGLAFAFSPNSKLLASSEFNGAVRLWRVSLFAHPYATLCADVGPPTRQNWNKYAAGEPQPKICA